MSGEWREVARGETMLAAKELGQAVLLAKGEPLPPDEEWRFRYAGDVFVADVRLSPEETLSERLTLVSQVGNLHFDPPVFLEVGDVYWTWGRLLFVRTPQGSVRRVEARPPRPDDPR